MTSRAVPSPAFLKLAGALLVASAITGLYVRAQPAGRFSLAAVSWAATLCPPLRNLRVEQVGQAMRMVDTAMLYRLTDHLLERDHCSAGSLPDGITS